jgi:hypothetical protein
MVRTKLLVVLSLGIAGATAGAQEKAKTPKGLPPTFAIVLAMDKAEAVLDLGDTTVRMVSEERAKRVEKDGKVEAVKYTVYKPIGEQHVRKLELKSAEVFTRGKKLSTEEVWKRLTVGATVLVSVDGKSVDPAYLGVLAQDTLVFVSPQYAQRIVAQPPPRTSKSRDKLGGRTKPALPR